MYLPEIFIERTKDLLGNEWNAFEKSLQEEAPVSIRLNSGKPSDISFEEEVPWASSAYYLPERPVFTLDPLFHAGAYYVQEASSMYLEEMIKDRFPEPIVALDLCAAPGGKSTHLSSLLPKKSLLIANEVISGRSGILSENSIKWGNPYTIVTNNDPKDIGNLSHFFDLILTDVPCSGEGMFRKDPAAISEWSVNNVHLCAERQRRIVADIWPALKPEGILIYSTCTYNREENEDNISWICRELGAKILDEPHRFFPHKNKGEGFFIAALQKKGDNELQNNQLSQKKDKKRAIPKQHPISAHFNYITQWLKDSDQFDIFEDFSFIKAFPKNYSEVYNQIKSCLKIISSGILLGEIKGKDLIPNHHLAMSTALSEDAFPRWEIDRETALHYLHKDSFQSLPVNLPKGYILLTYQNLPLGFIKNIGNRANNLYPSEWRIRMNIK
ncbi:RsmB/NOP family class I SAM-dependent RNA methyltransferase [Bacteroidales bacterium OttesenSCG-928-A17]|nr:RsmB/NOP family class I SAM-dependent RNA methyltransferase [Bacteroidales bacterium OttesenSCG-928-A17]